MPCRKSPTFDGRTGFGPVASSGYQSEAACLNACKEGACCESNGTCNVRPQCQCQGAGQTFRGVGTTCSPGECCVTCADAVQLTVQLAAQLGGQSFTLRGCPLYLQQNRTLAEVVCDQFGFRVQLQNIYQSANRPGCTSVFCYKNYISTYLPLEKTGPCGSRSFGQCNSGGGGFPAYSVLTRNDFELVLDTCTQYYDTVPLGCWSGFGDPRDELNFPQFISVGPPLQNPLP